MALEPTMSTPTEGSANAFAVHNRRLGSSALLRQMRPYRHALPSASTKLPDTPLFGWLPILLF